MSLRFAPPTLGGTSSRGSVRRSAIGAVTLTLILAACGSSSASTTPELASVAPSVAAPTASPSPSPSPTPSASPAAVGTIVLAGLSSVIDKPSQTIDPSTFGTTFVSETPAIYILYQLSPGSSGVVQSTWNHGTIKVNADSFTYPADAPWAYFVITYKNGFIPGDYEVVLKVVSTGDSMTLPFTVTGPRKAPPTPTPVPSGTSAFTLTTMASSADSSKSGPDTTAFTTTFLSSAPKLYVVFRLRSGLSGAVVCTMSANGSDVIKPITLTYSVGNTWGDFAISSSGTFPTGDYVATLTFSPTGEAVQIPFTVN